MIRAILLSAPRGAGKTTACQKLRTRLVEAGLRVGGILTPARYDKGGAKSGFDAQEMCTGERRAFAVLEQDPTRATIGSYRMDTNTMTWALQRVQMALSAPIDVVMIDEIGPLELVHKGGFLPALESLASAQASITLLIVRPELLSQLRDLLKPYEPITILLNLANRDQVPSHLFDQIWASISP